MICKCGKEFIPTKFYKHQKYCTTKCAEHYYNKSYNKTHDLSKYRHIGTCVSCNNYRRISKGNGLCDSCVNIKLHGRAKKPIVGTCEICKRSGLTMSGGKCKTCYLHGRPPPVDNRTSAGELELRDLVVQLYSQYYKPILFNYRPKWLMGMEIDVAIPSAKLGFEYDGRPHLDIKHPGFASCKRNDLRKSRILFDEGWVLIKIRHQSLLKPDKFRAFLDQIDNSYELGMSPPKEVLNKRSWVVFDKIKIMERERLNA